MYEVEDIDDVYEAVNTFEETVDDITYSQNGELENFVADEVSPAMIEAERALEAAEEEGYDTEEVKQTYTQARKTLYSDKRPLLEENGIDVYQIRTLGCVRRSLEHSIVQGEADHIL